MNGQRLGSGEARELVGRDFAGHVNAGVTGQWVTGRVVAYCESPTITIELVDGSRSTHSIHVVRDWAASDRSHWA